MKVRNRVNLTFVVVIGLLLIPSLYAAVRLAELRRLAVEERASHAEATFVVGRLAASLSELDRALREWVATGGPGREQAARDALARLEDGGRRLAEAGYEETAREFFRQVDVLAARVEGVGALVGQGRLGAATDSVLGLGPGLEDVRLRLEEIAASIDIRAGSDFREAGRISTSAQTTTLFAILSAMVVAVTLTWWATRALGDPLDRLRRAMADVAGGDFEAEWDLPEERDDEIGELSTSFRGMAHRLAELDRLKLEFLGMAGHELKTPLDVIRSYTEMLDDEVRDGAAATRCRELLERITEQTHAMSRLVSRLMDISRLESGSFGLEIDRIRPRELVEGVHDRFEGIALGKGIDLVADTADDVPEWLHVDVELIRDEVLGNLVSNALKATGEGGTVRVEARGAVAGVEVDVSDTGTGIREDHAPYVFERYYQVNRSRVMGSGLGLAIARGLIEAHGGWIRLIDPGEGTGARFRVFVPVRGEGTER